MEGSCQGVLAALVVVAGLAGRSREPGRMSHGFHVEGEEGTQGGPSWRVWCQGLFLGPSHHVPFPLGALCGGHFQLREQTPSSLHRGSCLLACAPWYLSTAIAPAEMSCPSCASDGPHPGCRWA